MNNLRRFEVPPRFHASDYGLQPSTLTPLISPDTGRVPVRFGTGLSGGFGAVAMNVVCQNEIVDP